MKLNFFKLTLGIVASVAILSGCGGGGTKKANPYPNPNPDPNPHQTEDAINLTDLPAGYQLNGYVADGKKAGEDVILIFCPNYRYTYYRGDESFNGKYKIKPQRDEVVMKDSRDGGSYALEAKDGMFEVGQTYKCRDLRPLTTGVYITNITPHSCPNNQ
jgi:hypothetical protein